VQRYDVELGKKKVVKAATEEEKAALEAAVPKKKSRHVLAVIKKRQVGRHLDSNVAEQFNAGRILACVASRPGQSGRADGYVLEGKELDFYIKKMEKKKK
jgi:small subunit ribosomal protein S8e